MTYRIFALVAFVALIVGVIVLSGGEREVAAPIIVEGPPTDPGYAAKKARLIQTGPDGAPLYTIDAQEVQQQPAQDTVDLQQVVLGFKDSAGDEWTATARHGEVAQNSGIVKLDGAVHAMGTLSGTAEPADITTERLTFDTNTQIVTTRDRVTLIMSGRKLDAAGMVANLKERHVQLESAVHGTYRP
ncbi:MAG TPA: LPS export ABC transporter periplasmic protein LptC [Steroidobacteraceae bacterium]|nr:LPS export ABC transporter periplasmic protein LptC [Steroidobacteraceae bacterium]